MCFKIFIKKTNGNIRQRTLFWDAEFISELYFSFRLVIFEQKLIYITFFCFSELYLHFQFDRKETAY